MMFPGLTPLGAVSGSTSAATQQSRECPSTDAPQPSHQYSYMAGSLGLIPSAAIDYTSNSNNPIASFVSPYFQHNHSDANLGGFIPYGMPVASSVPNCPEKNMKKSTDKSTEKSSPTVMKVTPLLHGSSFPPTEKPSFPPTEKSSYPPNVKPKKCEVCGDLISEFEVQAGKKKAMCSVCQKFLLRMKALESLRQDSETNKFKCETCQKNYSSLTTLKTHMRVHIGTKCFECHFCGKTFLYEGNLKTHLRVHTGEKPYCCNECGKCFSQSGTLKKHNRVHTGEKPYKCDVCDKSFAYSENLTPHRRVHTLERPFCCPLCERTYSQPGSLKAHMKVVHKEPRQDKDTDAVDMTDGESEELSLSVISAAGSVET